MSGSQPDIPFDTPDQCPVCGKETPRSRSFVSHYSQKHDPPYPWPDKTSRGHEWPKQRKEALNRDGGACVECGSQKNLEVHHKNNNSNDHRLSNLETLCKDCHMNHHQKSGAER